MLNVTKYAKNVAKSTSYVIADVAGEIFKTPKSFVTTNSEIMKEAYSDVKNYRVTFDRIKTQIQKSDIYVAANVGINSIIEDLKTGNFYNIEREQEITEKFGGDLANFDFDMDDSEFDWNDKAMDISDGDKVVATAVKKNIKIGSALTCEAVARTGKAQIDASRENTTLLYIQNEKMMNKIGSGMDRITDVLVKSSENNSRNQKAMWDKTSTFYRKIEENTNKMTAQLDELLQMQRNIYAKEQKKEKERKRDKVTDITDAQGMPDLKAYKEIIKKNTAEAIGEITGMGNIGDMLQGGNMLALLAANPTREIAKGLVKKGINKQFKKSAKDLDEVLGGLFYTLMGKMDTQRTKGTTGVEKLIGRIFGVKADKESGTVDTSKYTKGAISFDGITKKSITEVLPYYLRKMTAAVTGEDEKVFDFNTGKWTTVRAVRKKHSDWTNAGGRAATADLLGFVKEGLGNERFDRMHSDKASQDRFMKDVAKVLDAVYQAGDFSVLNDRDKGLNQDVVNMIKKSMQNHKYDYKYSSKNPERVTGLDRSKGSGIRTNRQSSTLVATNTIKDIYSTKASRAQQMRALEADPNAIERILFSEGINFGKDSHKDTLGFLNQYGDIDKKALNKTPMAQALTKATDEYKLTIFDYLRGIKKDLTAIRNNSFMNFLTGSTASNSDITENMMDFEKPGYEVRRISGEAKAKEAESRERQAYVEKRRKEIEQWEKDKKAGKKNIGERPRHLDAYSDNYGGDLRTMIEQMEREYRGDFKKDEDEKNKNKKSIADHLAEFGLIDDTKKRELADVRYDKTKSFKEQMKDAKDGLAKLALISSYTEKVSEKPWQSAVDAIVSTEALINELFFKKDFKIRNENGEEESRKGLFDIMQKAFQNGFSKLTTNIANKLEEFFKGPFDKFREKYLIPMGKSLFGDGTALGGLIGKTKDALHRNAADVANYAKEQAKSVKEKVTGKKDEDTTDNTLKNDKSISTDDRKKLREKIVGNANTPGILVDSHDQNNKDFGKFIDHCREQKINYTKANSDGYIYRYFKDRGIEMSEAFKEKASKSMLKDEQKRNKSNVTKEEKDRRKSVSRDSSEARKQRLINIFISMGYSEKDVDIYERWIAENSAEIDKELKRIGLRQSSREKMILSPSFINRYMLGTTQIQINQYYNELRKDKGISGHNADVFKEAKQGKAVEKYADVEARNIAKQEEEKNKNLNKIFAPVNKIAELLEKLNEKIDKFINPPTNPLSGATSAKGGINTTGKAFRSVVSSGEIVNGNVIPPGGPYITTIPPGGSVINPANSATIAKQAAQEKSFLGRLRSNANANDSLSSNKMSSFIDKNGDAIAEMLAKGGIGGIAGLLLGGPLLGAGLGAAAGLASKNDAFSEALFGKLNKETGERDDSGLISTELQKAFPDMKKFGLGGAIAGLITPFGPVGGLMIGSAIGFAKNNGLMNDLLFGETGIIGEENKQKIKKALPAMGLGAAAGALMGPFGLVGNAMLGAAGGYVASTDKFKEMIFGKDILDKDGKPTGKKAGGLMGAIKTGMAPLKDFGKTMIESMTDAIFGKVGDDGKRHGGIFGMVKDHVIMPLAEGFKPILKEVKDAVTSLKDGISDRVKKYMQDHVGGHFKDSLAKGAKAVGKGAINVAKVGLMFNPYGLAAMAGAKGVKSLGAHFQRKQIREGRADNMTAAERLAYRQDHKLGFAMGKSRGQLDQFGKFDESIANLAQNTDAEHLKDMASSFGMLAKGKDYLDDQAYELKQGFDTELSSMIGGTKGKGGKGAKQVMKLIRDGEYGKAEMMLMGPLQGVDGKEITDAQRQALISKVKSLKKNLEGIQAKKVKGFDSEEATNKLKELGFDMSKLDSDPRKRKKQLLRLAKNFETESFAKVGNEKSDTETNTDAVKNATESVDKIHDLLSKIYDNLLDKTNNGEFRDKFVEEGGKESTISTRRKSKIVRAGAKAAQTVRGATLGVVSHAPIVGAVPGVGAVQKGAGWINNKAKNKLDNVIDGTRAQNDVIKENKKEKQLKDRYKREALKVWNSLETIEVEENGNTIKYKEWENNKYDTDKNGFKQFRNDYVDKKYDEWIASEEGVQTNADAGGLLSRIPIVGKIADKISGIKSGNKNKITGSKDHKENEENSFRSKLLSRISEVTNVLKEKHEEKVEKRKEESKLARIAKTVFGISKWVVGVPLMVGFLDSTLLPFLKNKVGPLLLGKKNESGDYEGGLFSGIVNPIKNFFNKKFGKVRDWFANEGAYTDPNTGWSGAMQSIKGIFKSCLNSAVDMWKTGADKIINDVVPVLVEGLVKNLVPLLVATLKGAAKGIWGFLSKDSETEVGSTSYDLTSEVNKASTNKAAGGGHSRSSSTMTIVNPVSGKRTNITDSSDSYSSSSGGINSVGYIGKTTTITPDATNYKSNDVSASGKDVTGADVYYEKDDKDKTNPLRMGADGKYYSAYDLLETKNSNFNKDNTSWQNIRTADLDNENADDAADLHDNNLQRIAWGMATKSGRAVVRGSGKALNMFGRAIQKVTKHGGFPIRMLGSGVGGAASDIGYGINKVGNLGTKFAVNQADNVVAKGLSKNSLRTLAKAGDTDAMKILANMKLEDKAAKAAGKVDDVARATENFGGALGKQSFKGMIMNTATSEIGNMAKAGNKGALKSLAKTKAAEQAAKKAASEVAEKAVKETAEGGIKGALKSGVKGVASKGANALKSVAEPKATGLIGRIMGFIEKALTKVTNSKIFQKLFAKVGKKAAEKGAQKALTKGVKGLLTGIKDKLSKTAGKLIAKIASKLGIQVGTAATGIGIVVNVAMYVASFISGVNDARNIFGIVAEPTTEEKIMAGLVAVITDNFLIILPRSTVAGIVLDTFGKLVFDEKFYEKLEGDRKEAQEAVAAYNQANGTDLSLEEYNKKFNRTKLQKIGDAAKKGIKKGVKTAWDNSLVGFGANAIKGIKEKGFKEGIKEAAGKTLVGKGFKWIKNKIKGNANADDGLEPVEVDDTSAEEIVETSTDESNVLKLGMAKGLKSAVLSDNEALNGIYRILERIENGLSGGDSKEIGGAFRKKSGGMLKNIGQSLVKSLVTNRVDGVKNITEMISGKKKFNISDLSKNLDNISPEMFPVLFGAEKAKEFITKLRTNANADDGLTPIQNTGNIMNESAKSTLNDGTEIESIQKKLIQKNSQINKKINEGTLLPTDKEYWKIDLAGEDGKIGASLYQMREMMDRLVKAPFTTVASSMGGMTDSFTGSTTSSTTTTKTTQSSGSNSSSGGFFSTVKNSVKGAFSKVGSWISGLFGKGKGKHIYQRNLNGSYNIPGDTEKQSLADSGCGPVAAATVLERYGLKGDVNNAAKFALNNKYKEVNGGTYPEFFQSYLGKNGINAATTDNNKEVVNSLLHNKPVILMGNDPTNSGKTPYADQSHYVVATGIDKNGKVIVEDSESKTGGDRYDLASTLKNTNVKMITGKGYGRGSSSILERYMTNTTKASYIPFMAMSSGISGLNTVTTSGTTTKTSSSSLSSSNSSGTITKASGNESYNYVNNSDSGTTTAPIIGKDQTVTLPEGLGTVRSFMGWGCIKAKSSNQYKLREAAGENYDSNGYGIINGRYTIACTITYGNVGDYIDVLQGDGTILKAIIADIKSQGDDGCTRWGHQNGNCVIEFVVNKEKWYANNIKDGCNILNTTDPGKNKSAVISITNRGSYYDNPTGLGKGTSAIKITSSNNKSYTDLPLSSRQKSYGKGKSTHINDFMYKKTRSAKGRIKLSRGIYGGDEEADTATSFGESFGVSINNMLKKMYPGAYSALFGDDTTPTQTSFTDSNPSIVVNKNLEGKIIAPFVGNFKISSLFRWRTLNGSKDWHQGVDLIYGDGGDGRIYSICDGVVVKVVKTITGFVKNSFGNCVVIKGTDGKYYTYAHMAYNSVPSDLNVNTNVYVGTYLGTMGNTGHSYGAHLHFQICNSQTGQKVTDENDTTGNGNFMNPLTYCMGFHETINDDGTIERDYEKDRVEFSNLADTGNYNHTTTTTTTTASGKGKPTLSQYIENKPTLKNQYYRNVEKARNKIDQKMGSNDRRLATIKNYEANSKDSLIKGYSAVGKGKGINQPINTSSNTVQTGMGDNGIDNTIIIKMLEIIAENSGKTDQIVQLLTAIVTNTASTGTGSSNTTNTANQLLAMMKNQMGNTSAPLTSLGNALDNSSSKNIAEAVYSIAKS